MYIVAIHHPVIFRSLQLPAYRQYGIQFTMLHLTIQKSLYYQERGKERGELGIFLPNTQI